jgi:hypothetical protein
LLMTPDSSIKRPTTGYASRCTSRFQLYEPRKVMQPLYLSSWIGKCFIVLYLRRRSNLQQEYFIEPPW